MVNIRHFCCLNKLNYEMFRSYDTLVQHFRKIRGTFNKKKAHRFGMQVHHIVPRTFGGVNKPKNYVYVYPEEHMILHNMIDTAFEKLSIDRKSSWRRRNRTYSHESIMRTRFERLSSIKLLSYTA